MQKKPFVSYNRKRQLQVFSNMMQMKFKPASNEATTKLVAKNKQLIQQSGSQLEHSRSAVSRMINKDKKIKYLTSMSPQSFLVGNQNQVDMISILGIAHSFVDTDYCWSLKAPGSIDCLAIQQRKCLIAIVSQKKLYFYRYNGKKSKQLPQLIKQFDIKLDVKYIQFPKDSYLALFSQKQFEIYNVQQLSKIHKKCQKPYNQPKGFTLFSVPQAVENSLKIFFIEQQGQNHDKTFGLWTIKVNIEVGSVSNVTLQKPQKVYDIKRNLKKYLVIENFTKDIIFMNIGAEILAAKNGYILDSANVNIQSQNAKLKYISNQRLVHISDRKVQIYKMNILTNVTPNKIQISPVDALQIRDKPQQSQYFGLINFMNDNFAIFYQNKSQFNIYTKGEASYWFALSQSIPLQDKIQRIFDCGTQISKLNPQLLQEKCDMARKMGLNQKQLYLEIWNRSNKNSIADYQFILATRNYKTIHSQIQKKLKKQSMSFRQLLKIEESCLQILRESVYGPKCTEQNIQQFLASHCFIKKLKLYRDIQIYNKRIRKSVIKLTDARQQADQNNLLLINIQKYYEYKQFDIKTYLIQKIVQFSVQNKEQRCMQIRFMIRTFKFIYRVIYKQILQDIIKACKGKIIVLLQNIPQILPYQNLKKEQQLEQDQDVNLFQGIWNKINSNQWKNNLHIQNITTIDNKQVIKQFVKSIWFRRYYLTAHQFVNETKDKINQINDSNNSQYIFYFFIRKVFQLIPDQNVQFQIIYHLEQHYSKIPKHLKGKIFLHANLHKFYVDNYQKAKLQPMQLDVFLNQDDAKLFAYFFTQQKHVKNCILRQIKKIYEQTCEQGEGLILFNQGLLAYFKSQLSQISDLKYLLNRMNNQKTEFHQANLSIYEVLVRAMQYKLKLGTQEDIPIDQVLIYIQNIPIARDNQIMKQLHTVQKINQQAQRFKKMKINMTIKQIIDNCQDVISKIVQYQFQVNKIRYITDQQTLKQKTYKILAEVLVVKEKLYGDYYANLPFFVYLTKLLEDVSQIQSANILLADEFLKTHFPIDDMMKQNLVLYMYKWTFDKSPTFRQNYNYVKALITLLPEDNQNRLFIESQMQFAMALSTKEQPLQYPISNQSQYPRMHELNQILKYLPIEHVLKVDIDMIYNAINTMQNITLKVSVGPDNDFEIGSYQKITPHQVYSVFIAKYIDQNHLNDVIPLIKKLLTLQISNKRFNMIFFISLILKLSSQLNDQSKGVMLKTMFYCYDQPEILFEFIEYYFNSKQTVLQKGKKLKMMMDEYVKDKINFTPNNFLFNQQSKKALGNPQLKQKSRTLINYICVHLRQTKEQFQNAFYDILFSILCNEPYLAAKFIQMTQYQINFKVLRSYLSFLIQESIFDEQKVIQFCKIIFSMLLESNIKGKDIAKMILNPDKFYFNRDEVKDMITQEIDKKIEKTLKNFQKKKKSLGIVLNKRLSTAKQNQNQTHQIHLQLKNPQDLSSKTPSQYPFSDSDNDLAQQQATPSRRIKKKSKKESKNSSNFDKKKQRNKLMKRKNSFFGDKSNERKKSRNQQQQMQDFIDLPSSTKAVSLKVPEPKPNKIYVKRSITAQQSPYLKKQTVSTISEKQKQDSDIKTKINRKNLKDVNLVRQNQEESKLSKQQSQYSINQISQVQQEDASYRLKDLIVNNYDKKTDKIDFDALSKQQTHDDFKSHLKDVVYKIFEDRQVQNQLKLKIIKQVCIKYPSTPVNPLFFAVYQNIKRIEEAYNLGMPINRLMPVQGLFIESKTLQDLFKIVLPRIIQISSDQTIFKLTKLVSLGFNKNIYETQISLQYIKKMINEFLTGHTQVELSLRLETMKSLVNKMSVLVLKQKANDILKGIIANPDLEKKIIETVIESVKKRGNPAAAQQIRKIMSNKK